MGLITSILLNNSDSTTIDKIDNTFPLALKGIENDKPTLQLYTTYDASISSIDDTSIEFFQRRNALSNPSGQIISILNNGAGGAEGGELHLKAVANGALISGLTLHGDTGLNNLFPFVYSPGISVPGGIIPTKNIIFSVDESTDSLIIKYKYSDGTTVKSASITLS